MKTFYVVFNFVLPADPMRILVGVMTHVGRFPQGFPLLPFLPQFK